jgi:hypothetical protein
MALDCCQVEARFGWVIFFLMNKTSPKGKAYLPSPKGKGDYLKVIYGGGANKTFFCL